MVGIRQKLMLGFGSLLAVIIVIGLMTMTQIDRLGQAIDVILRENYSSVVACQDMKESLERMDSGILYTLLGHDTEGNRWIEEYASKFRSALDMELGNITLPHEGDKSRQIKALFDLYMKAIPSAAQAEGILSERQNVYFSTLQPLFQQIKGLAQEILVMNQENMNEANNAARRLAKITYRRMWISMVVAAVLAFIFSYLAHRWILRPINRLIESTNEIQGGNLDLVVEACSSDEIGRLSESFNEMTVSLRRLRNEEKVQLMRTRQAAEEVFKALPDAISVLDLDGRVEISTEKAVRYFGLTPGSRLRDLHYEWLLPLIQKAMAEGRMIGQDPKNGYIQCFIDGREYFFQPMAVPIPLGPAGREPHGAALILKDVTQVHEQQEMKHGVVSTVSHQLKTPMTSLRMSIHLLLEERFGALTGKQSELLLAAREDCERLVGILNDLLDIHRIESGKANVSLTPVSPGELVRDAIEPFLPEARDKGVSVASEIPDDLPEVMADAGKIRHVFENLLSNALRFTGPGGSVTIRSFREQDHVAFIVEDTGKGIAPEHMDHLFEQFYRAPGQDEKSGVGLGLAIVKEIIQTHGGDVSAESVIGKGSLFRFTLPVGEASHLFSSAISTKE